MRLLATKLCISRPFLSKLPSWLIPDSITVHMLELVGKIVSKKNKTLLVSLLHCLYEAQDPSLCQFVVEHLENELNLNYTSLTPVDSLAIGYFLSSVSLTTSNVKEFEVKLWACSLGDAGTKNLMQSICRNIDPHSTVNTHLYMGLEGNEIHEEGASYIVKVLNGTNMLNTLQLDGNPLGDNGLQIIFDALKQNTTVSSLSIYGCGMTDVGMASLADVVRTNNALEKLNISSNEIDEEGASHIAEVLNSTSIVYLWLHENPIGNNGLQTIFNALKQNKTLRNINIACCGLTDAGVASLADALYINNTLQELYIYGHQALTENGLTCLVEAVSRHSGLERLGLPYHLGKDRVRKTIINEARKRNGLPDIKVEGL